MLKPYRLLLYLLALFFSFFAGITYAGLVDAGKGQMLAAGAIVLGYGVIGAFLGLVISLILAYRMERKAVIAANTLLALGTLLFFLFYYLKYEEKISTPSTEDMNTSDREVTSPAEGNPQNTFQF